MKNNLNIRKLFSRSLHILKYNLVLVQPLLLFLLLIGLTFNPVNLNPFTSKAGLVLLIAVFGLFCAFIAGWFNMFYKTLEVADKNLSKEERAIYSVSLFKEFFPGVGQYFPQILLGLTLYIILGFIVLSLVDIVGTRLIGIPESIASQNLGSIMASDEAVRNLMTNISASDKIKLVKWYFLTLGGISLFNYLTMFWIQAVVAVNRNFLKAYFESLKAVFSKPITSFAIFISHGLALFITSLICQIGATNVIFQLLGLMLLVLVVVYFTILAFLYFEEYAENNSISRPNSFR